MTTEAKPYILVVEDNASDVHLFRLALDEASVECELTVLQDGAAALDWVERFVPAQSRRPNLAVIDLNLPKYNGFDVLSSLRRSNDLSSVPVMVLSSSVSPRDVARARAFSDTTYVSKPVDLDDYVELGRTVGRMLGRSG